MLNELTNVLWMATRRRGLDVQIALDMLQQAQGLYRLASAADPAQVLRLAIAAGCTAYDCEYVVVAQCENVPLVTYDQKLLKVFPQTAIAPEAFIG